MPGRSGKASATWLDERGDAFRRQLKIAALDPFAGYKTAIDDNLDDAVAVLDAFHVVKLGTAAVDEIRRRAGQDTLGYRGRKGDPLYGIQTILRAGQENLTDRQRARLTAAIEAGSRPRRGVHRMAERAATPLRITPERSCRGARDRGKGRPHVPQLSDPPGRPPGPHLRRWRRAFLAYFTTGRSSNGGTEPANGIIELHRRPARGYRNRDNYRPRMLLAADGLTP